MKIELPPIKDKWITAFFAVVVAALAGALVWAVHMFYSTPPYVDPEVYPVKGIDVSAHNGMMNLDAARRDGVEFVFIKATEGRDFRDSNFFLNYQKASHAGMKVGAYHFFRFDTDGVAQARHFLDVVKGLRLELGLAVDVEKQGNPEGVPPDTVKERLREMVEYLNLRGVRPVFYTNRDGYETYLMDSYPGCTLWICSFSETPINAEWTFWQYNHRGRVKGIRGDVDLNVFCGDRREWQSYLEGGVWPYWPHASKCPYPRPE